MEFLSDSFGRRLNNLRISVTQRCNFDCFFCHREGEGASEQEMTPREIEEITRVACDFGLTKVKLTGGEALLREDITEIISRIAQHAKEVSLTTNGSLLNTKAKAIGRAGLKRVNISLHSLNPMTFKKITGKNCLQQVEKGIEAATQNHLHPVKINMVVLRGINHHEIPQMIDFTANLNTILQIIEFQPVQEYTQTYWNQFKYNLEEVEHWLTKNSVKIRERKMHRRKKYYLRRSSGLACVEVVKPMHNSNFCLNCTRLRITSSGKIKPCLLRNDNLVDVIPYIRGKKDLDGLKKAFRKATQLREPYWRKNDES